MALQVDAIYEGGVLRPLQPLDLREHERVVVNIVQTKRAQGALAEEFLDRIKKELRDSAPAPGIEEVRRRLAKIPGSMAEAVIAERGDY